MLDSVFVSLGDQLYCGDELKPKNFSEVERLSGAEKRREQEATACLLARVCGVGVWMGVAVVVYEVHGRWERLIVVGLSEMRRGEGWALSLQLALA